MTTARGWGTQSRAALSHRDSASAELLRRCQGNQWDQIAKEIYNYYKADTLVLSAGNQSIGAIHPALQEGETSAHVPTIGRGQRGPWQAGLLTPHRLGTRKDLLVDG